MKTNISVSWYDGDFIAGAQCPHVDHVRRCKNRRCYIEPAQEATDCMFYQGGDCLQPVVKAQSLKALAERISEEIKAITEESKT